VSSWVFTIRAARSAGSLVARLQPAMRTSVWLCFSVAKPFLSLKLRSLLFELDISLVDFV